MKAWAAKTLPTLEEHQQLAKTTVAKVGDEGHKSTQTGKSSVIKGTSSAQRSKDATTAKGAMREQ